MILFQTVIVQLDAKECLFSASDAQNGRLQQVLARSGMLLSERKSSEFSAKDIVQDLDRLLKFKKGQQSSSSMIGWSRYSLQLFYVQLKKT